MTQEAMSAIDKWLREEWRLVMGWDGHAYGAVLRRRGSPMQYSAIGETVEEALLRLASGISAKERRERQNRYGSDDLNVGSEVTMRGRGERFVVIVAEADPSGLKRVALNDMMGRYVGWFDPGLLVPVEPPPRVASKPSVAVSDLVDVFVVVRRPTHRLMTKRRVADALGWGLDVTGYVLDQLLRLGWISKADGPDVPDPRYVANRSATVSVS